MRRVSKVMTKAEYSLALTFDDGTYGELSIADRLFGPMYLVRFAGQTMQTWHPMRFIKN